MDRRRADVITIAHPDPSARQLKTSIRLLSAKVLLGTLRIKKVKVRLIRVIIIMVK